MSFFKWSRRPSIDPVERTMRELSQQGTGMARIAHICATFMVALFSLGSLVALSGDAFSAIVITVQHGGIPSIPQAISIAVSTLMVVCCDIGLIYAAMTLRVLKTRGSDEGQLLHWVVLVGVSVIEAGTYLYMSWLYEHPAGWAWGLVIARALAAPLLSVYLSMARPHPVTPRDILHQAELAQGVQLVRDVIRVAQDPSASLADKMRLYEASAEMGERDKSRLQQMIAVVKSRLDETAASSSPFHVAEVTSEVEATSLTTVTPALPAPVDIADSEPNGNEAVSGVDDEDEAAEAVAAGAELLTMPATRYSARRLNERLGVSR